MSGNSEEYKALVLEDLTTFEGLSKPVRASILERLLVKKVNINRLHPNPTDEFTKENIGPNYKIVGDYANSMRQAQIHSAAVIDEPIIVEKMSTGGYMILNGHHRWMAAHRTGIKRVPVQIVNVAPDDEIFEIIKNSNKNMCVSIDLDEVLLAERSSYPEDAKPSYVSKKLFPRILRYHSGALINELRNSGFDVWLYTDHFHSSEYIEVLLKHQKTNVDGIVNALSRRTTKGGLRKAFIDKYKYSIHIDNEEIICVNNESRDYYSVELKTSQNNWAADVIKQIRQLKLD